MSLNVPKALLQRALSSYSYRVEEILRQSQEEREFVNDREYERLAQIIDISVHIKTLLADYDLTMDPEPVDLPISFRDMIIAWEGAVDEVLGRIADWLDTPEPEVETIVHFSNLFSLALGADHDLVKRVAKRAKEKVQEVGLNNLPFDLEYEEHLQDLFEPDIDTGLHHPASERPSLDELADALLLAEIMEEEKAKRQGKKPSKNQHQCDDEEQEEPLEFQVNQHGSDILHYLFCGAVSDMPQKATVTSVSHMKDAYEHWEQLFFVVHQAVVYNHRYPGSFDFIDEMKGKLARTAVNYGLVQSLDNLLEYMALGGSYEFTSNSKKELEENLRDKLKSFWISLQLYCHWSSFHMDNADILLDDFRLILDVKAED